MKFLPKLYLKPKRFKRVYRSETCLNCHSNIDVSDQFCPDCGQRNTNKKLSFSDLIKEFFAGVFSYDSRLQKSLGAILTRPGKISLEYTQGKRVKYVNPFRFFISIAILFFLILSWYTPDKDINAIVIDQEELTDFKPNDSIIKDMEQQKKAKLSYEDAHLYVKHTKNYDYQDVQEKLGFDDNISNHMIFKFVTGMQKLIENPTNFIKFLLPKLPFFLFCYIPLFSLFSLVVYIRRKFNYVDHLIFNFHEMSVFFFLFLIEIIITLSFTNPTIESNNNFNSISLYIFSIYHLIAVRYFYKQSIFKTILKSAILSFIFLLSCIIIVTLLMVASVAFY